jgi:hypothetical protein
MDAIGPTECLPVDATWEFCPLAYGTRHGVCETREVLGFLMRRLFPDHHEATIALQNHIQATDSGPFGGTQRGKATREKVLRCPFANEHGARGWPPWRVVGAIPRWDDFIRKVEQVTVGLTEKHICL